MQKVITYEQWFNLTHYERLNYERKDYNIYVLREIRK